MKEWLERYRGGILGVLSVLVLVLALGNVLKAGSITVLWLHDNKDAITAGTSIAGTILLLLGGVFSYYRFFLGRTFAPRANLKLRVSVHETTEDFNIHSVIAEITNLGSMPIWDPVPAIRVFVTGPSGTDSHMIEGWVSAPIMPRQQAADVTVIEATETSLFLAQENIPKQAWVVTYFLSIQSKRGDVWQSGASISNKATKD